MAVAVAVLFVAVAAACGSDDGASADDVERALNADLAGGGDRVVDLGTDPPKQVECRKDDGSTWRCRVTATSGKNIVCIVEADPDSGRTVRRMCAPMDN
ncbi:MAG TPA: hypothetical protein VHH55_05415 [Gaiellaceae bacterium]|nr:hypothetical protein [Gaiellaceae bacterium]